MKGEITILEIQEPVGEKSIAFAVQTAHFTATTVQSVLNTYLKSRTNKQSLPPTGKMSLKKLRKYYGNLTNLEINDGNIGKLARMATKHNINCALKVDKTSSPPKYFIFFQGQDTELMQTVFNQYVNKQVSRQQKPSIKEKLGKYKQMVKQLNKSKVREKVKERSL